jgi:asparagine synthetase B (glutamine-hydrolysing)
LPDTLGVGFQTARDTDVLVHAYRAWGTDCFEHLVGFRAVTLYDRRVGKVLLARDRIGKAPLYVCRNAAGMFWASEIKAPLQLLPEEASRIDERAVYEFAFTLRESYLIRDGWLKWILRYAMRDRLPYDVAWRARKMGFPFPLSRWLLQNADHFRATIRETRCPWIDAKKFDAN